LEDEYWLLLAAGVGTRAACRQIGIGRKTGYRWRAERGGIPPVTVAEQTRSGRYLSELERERIAVLVDRGLSVREIARRLDRAPSTISRELRRNRADHDREYDAVLAHSRARHRARRRRSGRLLADPELRQLVQGRLELEWSPEQIAAWLRREHPGRQSWHVCHETIYKALYWGGDGGLSRTLTARLRTGRPLRKRRRRTDHRRGRFVAPMALIDTRPEIVDERTRIGDWEGDLIVGRGGRSAIGTLVDRTSRLVRLVHIPAGHMAVAFAAALTAATNDIPPTARLTLTWDQGSEMARHDLLAEHFPEGVYFAPPGSPWLRGTNENTNGLLRQYFPKGSDLSLHDEAELRRVEGLLNSRPRRVLQWRTPDQVFKSQLAS
jgi:IS30 family transposase